jgi:hypothetical protein
MDKMVPLTSTSISNEFEQRDGMVQYNSKLFDVTSTIFTSAKSIVKKHSLSLLIVLRKYLKFRYWKD